MTDKARIEKGLYWDRAWSLVEGCTPVSEGCQNCWSARQTHMRAQQQNEKIRARYNGLTNDDGRFNSSVRLMEENLDLPMKVKKPTTWAIWNDLFHENVPDEFIWKVFDVMFEAGGDQHTYLILTKRPERMHKFIRNIEDWDSSEAPHIWLGVTAENQQRADERIPILLQIPAAVRFVSCEPLLSAIDLTKWLGGKNINDGCRKTILCPNGDRGIQYFTNRRDLETQRTDRECQRCESEVERNPDEKSRNNAKPGPFKSSNDRERQESYGLCSSCSVDVFQQVRNPGCFRDKPQGWESEEQSPKQLRISDQERKYPTCGSGFKAFGQERTTRGEEPECKTHSSTSARNTGDMGKTRNVSIANCRALQSIGDHNTGYLPSENMETSSRGINWCIVGGESGPGARPLHPEWVRTLRDQCQAAGAKFFFKSWGEYCSPSQMPPDTYRAWDVQHGTEIWDEKPRWKVGKKAAGRILDGQIWDEMPEN